MSQKEKFYHRVIGTVLSQEESAKDELEKLWCNYKSVAGFSHGTSSQFDKLKAICEEKRLEAVVKKQREEAEKARLEQESRAQLLASSGGLRTSVESLKTTNYLSSSGDAHMGGEDEFEDEELESSSMIVLDEVLDEVVEGGVQGGMQGQQLPAKRTATDALPPQQGVKHIRP